MDILPVLFSADEDGATTSSEGYIYIYIWKIPTSNVVLPVVLVTAITNKCFTTSEDYSQCNFGYQ